MLGVVPFGLVFGVLGIASGLSPIETILMSSILFGGASQVVFAQLWGAGLPAFVVGGSVCVINLRHLLYSASLADYLRPLPLYWRMVLAYLLTDEAYAVTIRRFKNETGGKYQHYFLLGSGLLLFIGWQITTIIGVVAGEIIPEEWSLSFAIPLTFIAVVAPLIKTRADVLSAIAAATVSVLGQKLPLQIWLIVASITGITLGWIVYAKFEKRQKDVS